jgi:hypothetical protein
MQSMAASCRGVGVTLDDSGGREDCTHKHTLMRTQRGRRPNDNTRSGQKNEVEKKTATREEKKVLATGAADRAATLEEGGR